MIQIYTHENALKNGSKKYCFRSVVDQTLTDEQLVKEIIGYNSTITEADAKAVLAILNDRVKHFVNLGYRVELPFGYVFVKANGTVDNINDRFVAGTNNHRLTASFKFKPDASSEMENGADCKMATTGFVTIPAIKSVCSVNKDGKDNESLSFAQGDMLRMRGDELSFNFSDEKQGIILVGENGDKVRLERYSHIGSNLVEAYTPQGIAPQEYEVKIVTKPGVDRYETSLYGKKISLS